MQVPNQKIKDTIVHAILRGEKKEKLNTAGKKHNNTFFSVK